MVSHKRSRLEPRRQGEKGRVVVIGAGIAGLAAARELEEKGFSCVVLEARARLGGRAWTSSKKEFASGVQADLGACFIHGIDHNPVAVLAERQGKTLVSQQSSILYDCNGWPVDQAMDKKWERIFNETLERACNFNKTLEGESVSLESALELEMPRSMPAMAQRLFNWHVSHLEYSVNSDLDAVDNREWDQDDAYSFRGLHCMVSDGGLGSIAESLGQGLDVRVNTPVKRVSYWNERVVVETKSGEKEVGDACIVTLPLGVLKSGNVEFSPCLPQEKLDAIDRLGFGVLNKVVLAFPRVFWDAHDFMGYTSEDRGEWPIFIDVSKAAKRPVLVALISGSRAESIESQSDDDVLHQVMKVLKTIFGKHTLKPVEHFVTRWKSDPYSKGSYSFLKLGSTADDYDLVAAPVFGRSSMRRNAKPRVFFAGEATNRYFPATIHGAFLSGIREAIRIDDVFARKTSKVSPSRALFRDSSPPKAASGYTQQSKTATNARMRMLTNASNKPVEKMSLSQLQREVIQPFTFEIPNERTSASNAKRSRRTENAPLVVKRHSQRASAGQKRRFLEQGFSPIVPLRMKPEESAPKPGDRVEVFWTEENQFFKGFVVETIGSKLCIVYDDGDYEEAKFEDVKHELRILPYSQECYW